MKAYKYSQTGASASAALQCQTNPPQRVLVVEDEPDMRQLDTEVLKESGYQVDTAENGLAALRLLNTGRYDLMILEDELPMVKGLALVEKLRSQNIMVPVILVLETLPAKQPSRDRWPQIQAILLKPYTITELSRTVREVLHAVANGASYRFAPPSNWQGPVCGRWVAALKA